MKTFFILCVLSFVGLSFATKPVNRRPCIYINGICKSECEKGTYFYATGCRHLDPEPTCINPNPVPDRSRIICDFSACYCDPPTVRNEDNGKCVPLDECPKKNDDDDDDE